MYIDVALKLTAIMPIRKTEVIKLLAERIATGVLIDKEATIKKLGNSWTVILNSAVMSALGITEPTPCQIYKNKNGDLIIEINQNDEKDKRG